MATPISSTESSPEPAGVGAERVVAAWLGRVPVVEAIGSDHLVVLGSADMTSRQARALKVMPWTSRMGGPWPAR